VRTQSDGQKAPNQLFAKLEKKLQKLQKPIELDLQEKK